MEPDSPPTVDGADQPTVSTALADGDPLPGTGGFAGALADGRLVRDVLGRRPLFSTPAADGWAFDPTALEDPVVVPAGHCRTPEGDERAFRLPDPPPATDAVDRLIACVRETVLTSVRSLGTDGAAPDGTDRDGESVAVAFSGGVDSAAVAAGVPDAPLYVVGFPGAHDVAAARTAADAMGRDLRIVELVHEDLVRAVPTVARATGRTNPMDVAIALPLYLVGERVAADGLDRVALGQGADELFGGYAKVANAPDDDRVTADTVRRARRETVLSLPDGLERDVLALRAAGVEPAMPLLHDRVVRAALPLPGDLLVAEGTRKVALREALRGVVPDPVRRADKKAVQYGSYVSRELDRLARQAGFKRRMDDHVGRYVRELCDEAGVSVPAVDRPG
jgi:asparagine synthase (glutamine-hydrolysing)